MENIKGMLSSGVVEAEDSEVESDGSGELESGEEEVSESSEEEPPPPPPPPPPPKRPIIRSNKKHNNIIRRIPHRDFLKQKRKSEALKAFHKFSKKMKLDTGLSIKTIAGGDIVELDELLSDSDESFTKEDSESSDGLSESEFTVDPEAALEPEGENESYIDPETGAITIPGQEPIPGGPLELDNDASVASMGSVASADSSATGDAKTLSISDIIEGGSEFDLDKNVDIEEILGANQFTIEKKKSLIENSSGSSSGVTEQGKVTDNVTSKEDQTGNAAQEKPAEGITPASTTGEAAKTAEDEKNKNAINVRRNIREVMDEKNLDASTLAAQRQESERLARVQEQQRIIREVRRQIALGRQQGASLLKGANLKNLNLPGTVLMKVPPGGDAKKTGVKPGQLVSDVLKIQPTKGNLTPSVSIAPVGVKAEVKGPPKEQDKKEVVEIVDSTSSSSSSESPSSDSDDCIMLSDSELPPSPEPDEDPHNSGLHVNDAYNVPDEQGRVQINIGHPENEEDIFLAPQIARIIKPHQIGGVRFLFDNIIESVERFSTSTGFGCILAHSMGLGKTLQIVCFCDIFLRHTKSKTVLCIMPINTLQNWVAEFNMWLPTDASVSPLSAQGEVRIRNFPIFVLNDSHKTLEARAKIIKEWSSVGGVLMIGYELYRLLSLKKNKKPRNRKKKNEPPEPEKPAHSKVTAESKIADDKTKEKEEKGQTEVKDVPSSTTTPATTTATTATTDSVKKTDVNGVVHLEENKDDDKSKIDEKDGEKTDKTEKEEELDEESKLLNEIFSALVKPGPDLVICDEGHRIKNSHSNISYALKQMRTKRRIVLTGYPLQNNLLEYWCMVDFVRPNYLGTKTEFSNMFERPIQNGQCIDSTPQDIRLMRYRAHVLHSLLLGFVQRRSHAVLQTTLPQKEEYVLLIRMTELQRKLYDTFMNEVVRKKTVPNPLKAFAVCCKIWNHPDVLYYFLKQRSEMAAMIDYDLDIEDANPGVTAAAIAAARRAAGNNPIIKRPGRGRGAPRKNDKVPLSNRPGNTGKPAASIPPNTSGSTDYNSYDSNKPAPPNGPNQYGYGGDINQHPNSYPYGGYQQYPPQPNYYGQNNSYGQHYNNEYYPQQPYQNNFNQHYPPNPQGPNAPPPQHYQQNSQYNQQGYWGPDNNYYNHNNYYPNNQPPYQPTPDAYGNVYDPYGPQQYQGYPNSNRPYDPNIPQNGPFDPNAPNQHRPYDSNVPNQNGSYNHNIPNQSRPFDPNMPNSNAVYDPNTPNENRQYDPNAPNPTRTYDTNLTNSNRPYDPNQPYDPNVPNPNRPYDPNAPNSNRPYDPNVPNPNVSNPSRPYDPNVSNPTQPYDPNVPNANRPYDPNIPNPNRPYDPTIPNSSRPYDPNAPNINRPYDANLPNVNQPYDPNLPGRPYETSAPNGNTPHQAYPSTPYQAAHPNAPPVTHPLVPVIPPVSAYRTDTNNFGNTAYSGYPTNTAEASGPVSSDVKPVLPPDTSSTWSGNNIPKDPTIAVNAAGIKTQIKTDPDEDVKIADLDSAKIISDVKSEIKVEVKEETKDVKENVKVEIKKEENVEPPPAGDNVKQNVDSSDKKVESIKGDEIDKMKKSKKSKEKSKDKKSDKKGKEKSKDDEDSDKQSDDEKKEEEKPEVKEEVPYEWANDLLKNFVPGIIENSAKMELLFCILQESIKIGDRLLLFSQSLFTLNLIEDYLQKNYIPGTDMSWGRNRSYYRLDGSTSALEREKLINEFNSNPSVHLFLVSTRAGSLGINLVGANRVVVFDASWNPCHDTQAVCRVYRYGQQKPCYVYRFVMDHCLEKKIYDRQINKQGMSDRVVDECNPDAVLSMKEVTNLCWDNDEKETELKEIDITCKDKYRDDIMKIIIQDHAKTLSKEPFQHESLLVDRKEKKLSSAEKRLAQRGYELEKKAAANPKPTMMYRTIRTADGSIIQRPVASVRPMQHGGSGARWIPAEVWQRQGMTAQEMTLPLDVVIPTNSAEKTNIVLKAGQRVMVLKSPKGIYMQLESGKIIAIKTSFKVGQKPGENANKDTNIIKKGIPSRPGNVNLPGSLKNNSAITVISKSGRGGMQKIMTRPNILTNKPGVRPIMPMTRIQDMKVRPMNPTMSVRGRPPLNRPARPIPIQNSLNIKIQANQNVVANTEKEKSKDVTQQTSESVPSASYSSTATSEVKDVKPVEVSGKEPVKQVENDEFEEQPTQAKILQPSSLPEDIISEDSSQEKTYVDLSDKSESKITTKPSTKKITTPLKQVSTPAVMKDCKIPIKNSFLQNDSMPMSFLNQVTIKRTTVTPSATPSPSTSTSVSPAPTPETQKPGPVNLIADEVLPSEATLSEHKLPSATNSQIVSADENSTEDDLMVKEKKIYKPNLVDRKTKINSLKNYRHQKPLQKPILIQSDVSLSKMSPVSTSSTPTPPPLTKTPDKFESSLSRLEKTATSISRMTKPGGMSDFQQSLSDITRTYSPETSDQVYKPGPKSRKKKPLSQAEESLDGVEVLSNAMPMDPGLGKGPIPIASGYGETPYPQPIPGPPPADPYAAYSGYPPTGGPYPPPVGSYPAPAPYPPPPGPPYYQGYPPAPGPVPYTPYHHPPQPYPPAPYPSTPAPVSYPNPNSNPNPPQW